MYLGKAIRLGRLFDTGSGRMLAITLDHAIARGVLPGLVDVEPAISSVAAGRPDAITLQKGIASRAFSPAYSAAGVSLIVKATSYSPFHRTFDTPTATVEEAVHLGADAISVGMLVGDVRTAPPGPSGRRRPSRSSRRRTPSPGRPTTEGTGSSRASTRPSGASPRTSGVAILLPEVMRYNLIGDLDKFVTIARIFGENTEGLSRRDAAELSVKAVGTLARDVGIPDGLARFGVEEDRLYELAKAGMATGNIPVNPRQPVTEDLVEIMRNCMGDADGR